jgi:hypothetical protein
MATERQRELRRPPHLVVGAGKGIPAPHIRSLYDGTYLATDVYVPVERSDDEGHQIGHVGLSVTAGGAERTWHGWRRDGTPDGKEVGTYETAEQAMAAVDAAG